MAEVEIDRPVYLTHSHHWRLDLFRCSQIAGLIQAVACLVLKGAFADVRPI